MEPLQSKQLSQAIDRFSEQHVLVIGDIMVDEYLWGFGQQNFAGSASANY